MLEWCGVLGCELPPFDVDDDVDFPKAPTRLTSQLRGHLEMGQIGGNGVGAAAGQRGSVRRRRQARMMAKR